VTARPDARHVPASLHGDEDALTAHNAVMEAVNRSGEVFLSHA